MDFTKTFHLDTHPNISPYRAELSQSGRTIFITGASRIERAIAHSFAKAGAARLALIARRPDSLSEAKDELEKR